ncbi:hypothetical protein AYO45_00460 [Gammaproteobacteria bacterium SCGC AG-212-F23]|nr:hypothetical protein AYO45_00460 [Gammaproteobacteria bacterium SCGC AG-212-F23]
MSITVTELRTNLYKIVDQVIATGVPVEIERKGVKVKLIAEKKKNKLSNLIRRPDCIIGDPEDIVHMDWSEEWNEDL